MLSLIRGPPRTFHSGMQWGCDSSRNPFRLEVPWDWHLNRCRWAVTRKGNHHLTPRSSGSAGTAPALVVTYTATHTHNLTDLIKRCYV